MRMRLALMTLAILPLSTVFLAGEIHEAAAAGDLARVGALLDETPALAAELDEQGRLPLHYAALHGHEEMIRRITAANAEVNLTDGRCTTCVSRFSISAISAARTACRRTSFTPTTSSCGAVSA